MSQIQSIIVDDELYSLEALEKFVEKTGFMRVEKKYLNPLEALGEIELVMPQVAFIDIRMPNMDGLTLAEKILEKVPSVKIIFITAWDQYAVKAFDLNALDYVMKPVKAERFNKMAERIKNEIMEENSIETHKLKINCSGSLNVSIDDIPVKWQRTKAAELFAYLLMNHNEYIYKDVILEELWPSSNPVKALPLLQTSVCKIRNLFSEFNNKLKLDYSGGKYCLITQVEDCDYINFEKALARFDSRDSSTYQAIEEAVELFQGGFLEQEGFLWSIIKNEFFRQKLLKALCDILNQYESTGNTTGLAQYQRMQKKLIDYDID